MLKHNIKRLQSYLQQFWIVKLYPAYFLYRWPVLISSALIFTFIYLGSAMGWFRAPLSNIHPLEAVPNTSTVIFKTSSIQSSYSKITENNYQSDLEGIGLTEKWILHLEKLIALFENHKEYKGLLEDKVLLSAAQLNGVSDFEWLHVMKSKVTVEALKKELSLTEKDRYNFRGQRVYHLEVEGKTWVFCHYKGLLLMSPVSSFVEAAIQQMDNISTNLRKKNLFREISSGKGESDLSVYVNFNTLSIFMRMLCPGGQKDIASLGDNFKVLSLDSRFQASNFVMTGHLYQQKTAKYWNWLASQPVREAASIASMIPENVAMASYIDISSFPEYYRKRPQAELHKDFDQYILPWLGSEAAYFITEPTSVDFVADKFVVLASKDTAKSRTRLSAMSTTFGILDSNTYKGIRMIQLGANNFLSPLWGGQLKVLETPYYAVIDQYVVFCNSASVMELWIDKYLAKKTIDQLPLFAGHVAQMKSKTSMYLLINTANVAQLAKYFIQKDLEEAFDKRFLKFRNLTPVGIQLTAHKGHFLFTASISYNKIVSNLKTNLAWRTTLKAKALIPPTAVENHKTGEYEIFVQDVEKRIYLINRAGKILWEKPVDGRIMSAIQQVDYYNNNKLQYAFNTSQSIYVFDRKGVLIKQIPLVAQAANALLAVDYGKGLRFFVSCKNGRIYGFDKHGKPLSGWNPNSNLGTIQLPIKYFELGKEDYMVAMNRKGKLFFLRRNAKSRMSPRSFSGYFLSDFAIDLKQQRIIAGASNGKVYVCNFKGKKFGIAAPKGINREAHFVYADVFGDHRPDFIRQAQKRLAIHYYDSTNTFKELLSYNYDIPQDDIFPLRMVGKEKAFIGSVNKTKKKIYLVDAQGQLMDGFPLIGDTKFELLDLFRDNNNTLLVANEKQILAYKLKH